MYNNICMYNIYVHTFITNFKFISKLEQGGKKKFEKKKTKFYIRCQYYISPLLIIYRYRNC